MISNIDTSDTLIMPPRYYFDTSVFDGVFDCEFEYETRILFNRVEAGEIKCVYSALAETELKSAPERVRRFFQDLSAETLERIEVNEAVVTLARKYIEDNVGWFNKSG